MSLSIQSKKTLNNGVEMPIFGIGVFQSSSGSETQNAVRWALDAGYRLIDTARIYGNETDVGKALHASGLSREEVFLTTKLWNSDHGYDKAKRACEDSIKRLGVEYLDLYLIHWPVYELRRETWKALESLQSEGLCRAVGVSNYTQRHLEELFQYADQVPAVNQVEFHAFLYQDELLAFSREHKIQLESYSPLTKGKCLDDPTVALIARKHNKTSAQVLIRWVMQHEVVVIPKSSKQERILENADVFDFELSSDDMAKLNSLDKGLRTSWDPTDTP